MKLKGTEGKGKTQGKTKKGGESRGDEDEDLDDEFFSKVWSKDDPEEDDVCPVCIEPIVWSTDATCGNVRNICCGKGLHAKCNEDILASTMSYDQKEHCPMCRALYPAHGDGNEKRLLKEWSTKGKTWAQVALAQRYLRGLNGVKLSYKKGLKYSLLAAKQGHVWGMQSVAKIYYHGQGVKKNLVKSHKWGTLAAINGHSGSMYHVGTSYLQGNGVKQDYYQAKYWFRKAGEKGEEGALASLRHVHAVLQGGSNSVVEKEGMMCQLVSGDKGMIRTHMVNGQIQPVMHNLCNMCGVAESTMHTEESTMHTLEGGPVDKIKLRNCKCKHARYCSVLCQKTDWDDHVSEHRRWMKVKQETESVAAIPEIDFSKFTFSGQVQNGGEEKCAGKCYDYQKGNCVHGANCRFSHDGGGGM